MFTDEQYEAAQTHAHNRLVEIFGGLEYKITKRQGEALVNAVLMGKLFMLRKDKRGNYTLRVQS